MNDKDKITKEVEQYLLALRLKGYSETGALAFALASAFSIMNDDQLDDLFALLSKA